MSTHAESRAGDARRPPVDWDARRYDRVSDPQFAWGQRVIARLAPRPGERILDIGCGTGRLTVQLSRLASGGLIVGVDASAPMLQVAAQSADAQSTPVRTDSGPRPASLCWVRADGTHLPFRGVFDAVFSTATLHWIADHGQVFRSVFLALRPGGRFVAQAGGGANLTGLYTRAAALMQSPRFRAFFDGWHDPWNFAEPEDTRAALERAGFRDPHAALEPAPVAFTDPNAYAEFVSCVCLRHHLARLPPEHHEHFVAALTTHAVADDQPLTLDYWRLNIDAHRPVA